MHFDPEYGLVGKVEIPEPGWMYNTLMGVLLKGVDTTNLDIYPIGHGRSGNHNQEQRAKDQSWTTSRENFQKQNPQLFPKK